ncbi:SRPBCC family protein [Ramlibacter sp.]|uniref:SRPBCC family protein n=1 Tax=Ramlibacter sp. TaxID=1917967 RepID=UPI002C2F3D5B|nr:SRPBCC family protein [Ramlibacter sp.]HWI82634.1 SRPBCC family protein [Ramlibacter sp.]
MQATKQETGTVAAVAALAAGASWLLSKQLQARRAPTPAMLVQHSMDQARRRPGALGTLAALAMGGMMLSRQMRKARAGSASSVQESIDVDVPVSTAYNQWTQFEAFPQFMASVQEVRQVDDTHLHWRADVAGKIKEWDAEITEQRPDERIAWRSTGGVRNAGVVTFHRISDNRTRVMLQMDYDPETVGEKIGDALGGVKLTAKGNLQRFKELIERRGVETGAWRGTVTH